MYYLGIGFFLGLFAINLKRISRKPHFELTPNCLLTKYPIIFVPGKTSFFYFLKYWNSIPHYLKEHGYEVYEIKFNPLTTFFRKKHLIKTIKTLSQRHKKVHLVFDHSQMKEAYSIDQKNFDEIQAIHIFSEHKSIERTHSHKIHFHQLTLKTAPINAFHKYIKCAHDLFTQSPYFISLSLLGGQSTKDNLTIEPHYLQSFAKVAEQDWI